MVLATGGAGQLFSVTTNPPESTGDGVAMALRAGVPTADVEFVQFHPTALHHPAMPRPLLSEALRGHGALLRDRDGERFVDELAPRDVVSRAMAARMAEQGVDHLWLDATGLERFSQRFPTIAVSLASIGLDPQRDWLPIAPAAHHLSGGAVADLWGATALPGLWAVGEVACTGVHGANRLASNSLLEGMVFGARLAERILAGVDGPEPSGALRAVLGDDPIDGIGCSVVGRNPLPIRCGTEAGARAVAEAGESSGVDVTKLRDTLQRAMTCGQASCEAWNRWRAPVPWWTTRRTLCAAPASRSEQASWRTWSRWPTRAAGVGAGPDREPRRGRAPGESPRHQPGLAAPTRARPGAVADRGRPIERAPRPTRATPGPSPTRSSVRSIEDLGPEGDLTAALVPPDVTAGFALRARRDGVLAGRDCATEAFTRVGGPALTLSWYAADGAEVKAGDTVLEVAGPLRPILTAERTALNFLGRLSGIATLTARFVAAAHERNVAVAVLDTRKTTPGLRAAREGGRAGRRRDQSPGRSVRRRAGQGQPSGGNGDHRGRRAGPRSLAGSTGRDRMRCARSGGRGRTGRGRRRPARQHGSADRAGSHRRRPSRHVRGRSSPRSPVA